MSRTLMFRLDGSFIFENAKNMMKSSIKLYVKKLNNKRKEKKK
ncbi:hypothetical protein [Oceanirhabdus seepicola]|nr:hypothetical protein [Oceanirhabdus seepicola]